MSSQGLTPEQHAQIIALKGKLTQAKIGEMFGIHQTDVSAIHRNVRHAPYVPEPRAVIGPTAPPSTAPLLTSEDPSGLERAREWMRDIQAAADIAKDTGDIATLSALASKMTALLEYERKAMPDPPKDPNEDPDMISLADSVWAKIKKAMV